MFQVRTGLCRTALRLPRTVHFLLALIILTGAGCATRGGGDQEGEPVVLEQQDQEVLQEEQAQKDQEQEASKEVEGEVPLPVAETEPPAAGEQDRKQAAHSVHGRSDPGSR